MEGRRDDGEGVEDGGCANEKEGEVLTVGNGGEDEFGQLYVVEVDMESEEVGEDDVGRGGWEALGPEKCLRKELKSRQGLRRREDKAEWELKASQVKVLELEGIWCETVVIVDVYGEGQRLEPVCATRLELTPPSVLRPHDVPWRVDEVRKSGEHLVNLLLRVSLVTANAFSRPPLASTTPSVPDEPPTPPTTLLS